MQLLIDAGAQLEARCAGCTPLLFAADHGHAAAVQLLLYRGADATAADEFGNVLHHACFHGHGEVVDMVLQAHPSTKSTTPVRGSTALHFAAAGGHTHICAKLLAAGASASCTDSLGRTAIDEATASDHADVVRMLLKSLTNPKVAENTVIHAAHWGATASLQALLAHFAALGMTQQLTAAGGIYGKTA